MKPETIKTFLRQYVASLKEETRRTKDGDRFGFDYGFVLARNLLASSGGTHIIGIRYRFGGK